MKVSLNWLREFLPLEQSAAEISDLLTFAGVEVEGIHHLGVNLPQVVVAQILGSEQHPNADRLSVCQVDDGSGQPRQIVCGAKNYKIGDKIPLALPGAVLPGDFKIKVGKLRGVESEGMMCSAKELGISEESAGLHILPPGSDVGTPIGALFPPDTIFDLEITPNRPDLLSHQGIARELAAITGGDYKSLKTSPTYEPSLNFPIRLESSACPFYTARIVRHVSVGPSPEWLVRKLQAVGLRSINNVVDITNFVLLELGQPLHAFDLAKVKGGILVRNAFQDEKFRALDGRVYLLTTDDLVIADEEKTLALAGVMGGEDSGVTVSTTDILLESALFAGPNIRRTSRRLGLSSDSSYRFERGVDPGLILAASERAAHLLATLAGGIPDPDTALAGALPPPSWIVPLRNDRVRQLLGSNLPDARIEGILSGLGLTLLGNGNWQIPSHRADLTREVDLIEEIARVHGIQAIPSRLQSFSAPISPVDRLYDFQIALKRALAARGFSEARTLSLRPVGETLLRTGAALRVRNPLTEDQTFFRETLTAGLLAVAESNQRLGATSIRLLETGRIFQKNTSAASEEILTLGLLVTGQTGPAVYPHTPQPLDFFSLKSEISALTQGTWQTVRLTHPALVLAAEIFLNGTRLGWIGQLTPALVRSAGIKTPVFVAELDLALWQNALPAQRTFSPLPRYPAVTRDIALLAPLALTHAELEAAWKKVHDPLLRDVVLFDLFTDATGEKIPADQKSLAYSFTYRAEDRTLTQDEVNAAHARIKASLVAECLITLRE